MVDLSFTVMVRPSQTMGQLGNLTTVLDPLEVRLFVWQQQNGGRSTNAEPEPWLPVLASH